MTSPWVDEGDATITDLDDAREGHSAAGPGQPGGRGIPAAYAFAAGVMVGAALTIGIMGQGTPAPETSRASAAVTVPSTASIPTATPSPAPAREPSPLPEPIHLPVGHPVSVEIDGMLVSLSVPLAFESEYYAPHLLATGRPDAPSLAITTTDQLGTGCLRLDEPGSGSPGPTASTFGILPTTAAARGPVAFTLDGYPGHYFHFRTPAGACHPNQVWDRIVGDFGNGRGASVELELWALDVSGTTLVFGSYAVNDAPAEYLEQLRAVAASAQVTPIQPPSATLTPAIIDAGFVGLSPPGANPSAPVPAVLVDEYPVLGGGLPLRGITRVYDDGRLIWYRFFDGPAGELSLSTGYLQQRLTPLGVAMVQAHADLAEKDPLALAEWLPPGAWEDREVRAYVPMQYAACLTNASAPLPGTFLVDLLPEAAADLVRIKPLVSGGPPEWECRGMTTDEARTVVSELQLAGFQQDADWNRYVLQYELDNTVVTFEPIFPDGAIGCSGCG